MSKRARRHDPQPQEDTSVEETHEGEQEGEGNPDEENNYGFQADENAVGQQQQQQKVNERVETPEEKQKREDMIREITRLISRYPGIKPRTNCALIESLQQLELSELQNVYYNAMNDIQEKRGTPASEFVIMVTCWFPERLFLPGITEKCLEDLELVRDVDSLITEKMGALGTVSNIIFRVANKVADIRWGTDYSHVNTKRRRLVEELYAKNNTDGETGAGESIQVHERDGTGDSTHQTSY